MSKNVNFKIMCNMLCLGIVNFNFLLTGFSNIILD